MKCEICEKEGTNYVSSRYGFDVYLCEDHRLTVLEYIESLKPNGGGAVLRQSGVREGV